MLGLILTVLFLPSPSVSSSLPDLAERLIEMDNFRGIDGTFHKFLQALRRVGYRHQSDLEVVLSSSPVLSPDVLFNTLKSQETPREVVTMENLPTTSASTTRDSEKGEFIDRKEDFSGPWFQDVPVPDGLHGEDTGLNEPSSNSLTGEFYNPANSPEESEFTKINASAGEFRLNFSQDEQFLISTTQESSRLILTCSQVDLEPCFSETNTLLVNNVGDLRFGRNSYIYCGPQVKVRIVSLQRKISLKIRGSKGIGEMECKFFTRKQRFLEGEESSCGKLGNGRRSKIIGGKHIAPGLFPYLAQLDMTKGSGSRTTCSGTLISKRWVLTAAHCLRGVRAISVYLGGTNRMKFSGNEMLIQAEKFILHKNWNSKSLLGDIALVKLSKQVEYTNEISPVCLPDKKLRNENMNGKKGVAVGWGRIATGKRAPQQAYRVPLPFLSDFRCLLAYPLFFRPKVMMCTESTEKKAICYGDSGGPLLYLRNQRVYQIGISSFSSSQVCGESFDVFTRVDDNYYDWITKRIRD